MREERVFLEHGVDLALVGRDVHDILAVEEDLALGGLQEAAEDAQQRRLAAAGGTEQRDKLVFVNIQADALEDDLSILKALDDILELDQFFLFRHGSNILSLYRSQNRGGVETHSTRAVVLRTFLRRWKLRPWR